MRDADRQPSAFGDTWMSGSSAAGGTVGLVAVSLPAHGPAVAASARSRVADKLSPGGHEQHGDAQPADGEPTHRCAAAVLPASPMDLR